MEGFAPEIPFGSPYCCGQSPCPGPKTRYQDAYDEACRAANTNGYGLNLIAKEKNKPNEGIFCERWTFECEYYGKPRKRPLKTGTRPAAVSSKKIGCTFSMTCNLNKEDGLWHTKYKKDSDGVDCDLHNHTRNKAEGHTSQRAKNLPLEVREWIAREIIIQRRPNDIAKNVHVQFPAEQGYRFAITAKDISNMKGQWLRDLIRGKSPMQWLLDKMEEDGVWVKAKWNEDNELVALFFSPKECIEQWEQAPYVCMADITHNTQMFNLYLLNFVGMSGGGWAPHLACALLSGESEGEFDWALDAFDECRRTAPEQLLGKPPGTEIPAPGLWVTDRDLGFMKSLRKKHPEAGHILCRWHVNMNVAKNTRTDFPVGKKRFHNGKLVYEQNEKQSEFIKDWNMILESRDEGTYKDRLGKFKAKWNGYGEDNHAVKYAVNWLDLYQEKLVRCYIDRISHFGVFTTSPCEGVHGGIKGFLPKSKGNLIQLYFSLREYWTTHHNSINAEYAKQHGRKADELSGYFYLNVREWIHPKALHKTQMTLHKLPANRAPLPAEERICRCAHQHCEGRPCHHALYIIKNTTDRLEARNFHLFWHRFPGMDHSEREKTVHLKDPKKIQNSGRPRVMNFQGIQTAKSGSRKGLKNYSNNSTMRGPSQHEYMDPRLLPSSASSSAPAPANPVTQVAELPVMLPPPTTPIDSTGLSLERLANKKVQDLYIRGTQHPRASKRALTKRKRVGPAYDLTLAEFNTDDFLSELDGSYEAEQSTDQEEAATVCDNDVQDLYAAARLAPISNSQDKQKGKSQDKGKGKAQDQEKGKAKEVAIQKDMATDEEDQTCSEDEIADAPVVDKGKGKEKEKAVYSGDENEGFEDVDNFNSPPVTPQRPGKQARVHGPLIISPKSQNRPPPSTAPSTAPARVRAPTTTEISMERMRERASRGIDDPYRPGRGFLPSTFGGHLGYGQQNDRLGLGFGTNATGGSARYDGLGTLGYTGNGSYVSPYGQQNDHLGYDWNDRDPFSQ